MTIHDNAKCTISIRTVLNGNSDLGNIIFFIIEAFEISVLDDK